MSFFGDLLGAVASAVQTVIDVAGDIASTAIRVIRTEYQRLKDQYREIDVSERKEARHRQLIDVNDEILEFEKKLRRDGKLCDQDQLHLSELRAKRLELRSRIDAAKEFEVASDISNHDDLYGIKDIDPVSPNELTRLGGQMVMGKTCSKCQKPMAIRWPTNTLNPTLEDLFWSCTGFFQKLPNGAPLCKYTENLSNPDMKLFGHIQRPGMEVSSDKLNNIVQRPETSEYVKQKLNHAINEISDDYLCPVHHERMALKTKRNANGLLDLYYLRCLRCEQMVKIKSATQLDAILESYNGKGLFS